MEYESVIGLEIHARLLTHTKIFCGCRSSFGAPANTQVCPVCLGLPGALPVLNQRAVEYAAKAALALGCTVHPVSVFARKNYFYPDLPKGYQISQYEEPLASHGAIACTADGTTRTVRITRVHLEEDAGKSIHDGFSDSVVKTHLDFNRSGMPLIEIVTEPDLRSPAAAADCFGRLRAILRSLEVCNGNMEEGSLKCDANVSVRPVGTVALGVKVELKNINSFRFLERALTFEVERQVAFARRGDEVVHETRSWDTAAARTVPMRSKEEAHDYRYFPEPDLPPLQLTPEWIDSVRAALPELPAARQRRFVLDYELPDEDAAWLAHDRDVATFFESTAEASGDAKASRHWIMGPVAHRMNRVGVDIGGVGVQPPALAELIRLVESGTVSRSTAKTVFDVMCESGRPAQAIIDEEGLSQIADRGAVLEIVIATLATHPEAAATYRSGKTGTLGFLVGQVMRATKGQANPKLVNELLKGALDSGD